MVKSYVRWFPTLPYRVRLLVARPSETELSLGHPWRIIDDGDLFVIDDDDKGEKNVIAGSFLHQVMIVKPHFLRKDRCLTSL